MLFIVVGWKLIVVSSRMSEWCLMLTLPALYERASTILNCHPEQPLSNEHVGYIPWGFSGCRSLTAPAPPSIHCGY